MNEEERKLLENTAEQVDECLTILKRMQRTRRFELFIKIAYWVVIVGMAFGAYYFIQPYLENLMSIYSGVNDNLDKVNNLKNSVFDLNLF